MISVTVPNWKRGHDKIHVTTGDGKVKMVRASARYIYIMDDSSCYKYMYINLCTFYWFYYNYKISALIHNSYKYPIRLIKRNVDSWYEISRFYHSVVLSLFLFFSATSCSVNNLLNSSLILTKMHLSAIEYAWEIMLQKCSANICTYIFLNIQNIWILYIFSVNT